MGLSICLDFCYWVVFIYLKILFAKGVFNWSNLIKLKSPSAVKSPVFLLNAVILIFAPLIYNFLPFTVSLSVSLENPSTEETPLIESLF